MDPRLPLAGAVIVRDGRIVAVLEPGEPVPPLAAGAEVIDLAGRVTLPGFVDGHCHLELSTSHLAHTVQCFAPPHRDLGDICDSVAERARATPAGEWVIGRANFSLERWVPDQRPLLRADLD